MDARLGINKLCSATAVAAPQRAARDITCGRSRLCESATNLHKRNGGANGQKKKSKTIRIYERNAGQRKYWLIDVVHNNPLEFERRARVCTVLYSCLPWTRRSPRSPSPKYHPVYNQRTVPSNRAAAVSSSRCTLGVRLKINGPQPLRVYNVYFSAHNI